MAPSNAAPMICPKLVLIDNKPWAAALSFKGDSFKTMYRKGAPKIPAKPKPISKPLNRNIIKLLAEKKDNKTNPLVKKMDAIIIINLDPILSSINPNNGAPIAVATTNGKRVKLAIEIPKLNSNMAKVGIKIIPA